MSEAALHLPTIAEEVAGMAQEGTCSSDPMLEAMALGVAPAIVDYAGPGELATEGVGRKVPIGPRARIVADFGALLEEMAADVPGALAMGAAAQRAAAEHELAELEQE